MHLSARTGGRSFLLVLLTVLALALSTLSALATAPAAHAAGGSVTGRVIDPEAEPVDGATVSLYAVTLSGGSVSSIDPSSRVDATTDPDGNFVFTDVDEGQYTLQAHGAGLAERYLGNVFEESAADHFLVGSSVVALGDFKVAPGVTVSGVVKGPDGSPMASVYMRSYTYVTGGSGSQYWYSPTSTYATTAADGSYTLTGAEPGAQMTVQAGGHNLITTYLGGERTLPDADTFAADPGDVVEEQDLQLRAAGVVQGRITDEAEDPVENATVTAWVRFTGSTGWTPVRTVYTDADGTYTLAGIEPGQVTISTSKPGHATTYLGGYDALHEQSSFPLVANQTATGKDIVFLTPGSLSGTITGADGEPVADVQVGLRRWVGIGGGGGFWGNVTRSTQTDATGAYEFESVDPGSVTVQAEAAGAGYVTTYLGGVRDLDDSPGVQVESGTATTGADIALLALNSVSGKVTDANGMPVEGAYVEAQVLDADDDSWEWDAYTETGADGTFVLTDVSPGTVTLVAEADGHVRTYLGGGQSPWDAESFTVGADSTLTGKDITLLATGKVSGRVTDPSGGPVADAEVTAYTYLDDEDYWDSNDWAETDEDGYYELDSVEPGQVTVRAEHDDFPDTYLGDVGSRSEATAFTLVGGQPATGKDIRFRLGGIVQGVVKDPYGNPVADAEVVAVAEVEHDDGPEWDSVAWTSTGADGSYELTGVAPGRVTVRAEDYDEEYLRTYLGGTGSPYTATVFDLDPGETADEKHIDLRLGGTVEGTIRDPGGDPLAGAWVDVYSYVEERDGFGWDWVGEAQSGTDGSYSVTRVEPGDVVSVVAGHPAYLTTALGGGPQRSVAAAFALADEETAGGKDVQLRVGGTVHGTVTDPAGDPVDGAYVVAHTRVDGTDGDDWRVTAGSYSGTDGTYTLTKVEPGSEVTVMVHVDDHAPTFYGSFGSRQEADTFEVVSGESTHGIDVQAVRGGLITGVATDRGEPLRGVDVTAYREIDGELEYVDDSSTTGRGRFSTGRVFPGSYTLEVWDRVTSSYRYLGDVADPADAVRFDVVDDETVHVDLALRPVEVVDPPAPEAATTVTTLSLSKAKRRYGVASTATVRVAGGTSAATGTVQLRDGGKVVASSALRDGAATFALPAGLKVGKHGISVAYLGSATHRASTSATARLTVTKAKAKVTAKLKKKQRKKLLAGKRGKVTVRVTATGFVPTGKVTVVRGKKKVVARAKLKKSKVTLRLPKLEPGKHRLRAVYAGNATTKGKKSKKLVLRVRR